MTFPALPYATDRWDSNEIPVQAAGNLAAWTSHGGRVAVPVGALPATGVAYEPTGWNGTLPSVRFNATNVLTLVDATLCNYIAGTANKRFAVYFSCNLVAAGLITANLLALASSTTNLPFIIAGIQATAPGVYQLAKRDNSGLPSAGVNGRVGTNAAGVNLVLSFVGYGTTADIFVNGVSVTSGAGFAYNASAVSTVNQYSIGGLYRPTNVPTFGSGVNAHIYKHVVANDAPTDSTEQGLIEAWMAAGPDLPVQTIGVKPLVLVTGGTSTMAGTYGLPSPSTDNYVAKGAVLLGCAQTNTAANGTSSFKMNATSWTPPSWLVVSQYPDAARNVPNLISLAQAEIAAGNQPVIIVHQGPEVTVFDQCVALDPTLTWATFLAQVRDNWAMQRALLVAAGIPYLMTCSSQPSDNDVGDQLAHRVEIRDAARADEDGFWWDVWPFFAELDNTAIDALVFDGQHPNLTGQDVFAAQLANRLTTVAATGWLAAEWHFVPGVLPGPAMVLPATGRYLLIEESL